MAPPVDAAPLPSTVERPFSATASLAKVVIALSWIAVLALLCLHDRPPIVDWPNHMARHHLEALWLSGQALPPGYAIQYALMPNLGSDLIVPPLLLVMDTVTASKVFVILAAVLYWLGPVLFILQYANRSPAGWAACALLTPWILAGTFFWGFMNYYSGVGLAFLAATHHISMARRSRASIGALLVHAALLAVCYLWHLTCLGIYLVLAGCFMLHRFVAAGLTQWLQSLRREVPYILAMLPALGLMLAVFLTPKLNALAGGTIWSTPLRKVVLALGFFGAYDAWVDVPLMLTFALATLLMFKLALISKLAWPSRAPDHVMLAAIVFGALYLALPVEVGTTSGADIRMLPPLFFTVLALLARCEPARTARMALALVAALSVVRYSAIHLKWRTLEADATAVHAFFSKAPTRQKILVLTLDRASKVNFQSHLIGWAVPASGAYVSSLFSYAGQQPLILTRQPSEASLLVSNGQFSLDRAGVTREFDYVWIFDPVTSTTTGPPAAFEIPPHWSLVLTAGAGKLYKTG